MYARVLLSSETIEGSQSAEEERVRLALVFCLPACLPSENPLCVIYDGSIPVQAGLLDIDAPISRYVDPILKRLNKTSLRDLWVRA